MFKNTHQNYIWYYNIKDTLFCLVWSIKTESDAIYTYNHSRYIKLTLLYYVYYIFISVIKPLSMWG